MCSDMLHNPAHSNNSFVVALLRVGSNPPSKIGSNVEIDDTTDSKKVWKEDIIHIMGLLVGRVGQVCKPVWNGLHEGRDKGL